MLLIRDLHTATASNPALSKELATVSENSPSPVLIRPILTPAELSLIIFSLVEIIYHTRAVSNLFGTRDRFCGRQFFHEPEAEGMVSG